MCRHHLENAPNGAAVLLEFERVAHATPTHARSGCCVAMGCVLQPVGRSRSHGAAAVVRPCSGPKRPCERRSWARRRPNDPLEGPGRASVVGPARSLPPYPIEWPPGHWKSRAARSRSRTAEIASGPRFVTRDGILCYRTFIWELTSARRGNGGGVEIWVPAASGTLSTVCTPGPLDVTSRSGRY